MVGLARECLWQSTLTSHESIQGCISQERNELFKHTDRHFDFRKPRSTSNQAADRRDMRAGNRTVASTPLLWLHPFQTFNAQSPPLFVSCYHYFQASPVVDINMPLDSTGQYNHGYAIIKYQDVEAATYAWRLFLDIVFLHGTQVKIKFYSLPSPPPPPFLR